MKEERLYKTDTMLERTLRVSYPAGKGRMVLRTEQGWEKNIEPVAVSKDGNTSTFKVQIAAVPAHAVHQRRSCPRFPGGCAGAGGYAVRFLCVAEIKLNFLQLFSLQLSAVSYQLSAISYQLSA